VSIWKKLFRPPWRTIVPAIFLFTILFGGYAVWQPGLDIRDGRNDRGQNGIWLGHGWLGADKWFFENGKTNEMERFRTSAKIQELATLLKQQHVKDIFPHLCPSDPYGNLPAINDAQAERFLAQLSDFRVMPWIGGPAGPSTRYSNAKWRTTFIREITNMLSAHPGFAGVQINVEPLTSGDKDFIILLEQLHAALPKGKLLSVAAYPPPTRWQRSSDVHWDENYFREVARNCDQVAVMMYDTSLRWPKVYEHLMADWTSEVLSWSEGKPVLLGIPTYNDAGVEYHKSNVENMEHALLGIHRGLAERTLPVNYQGVAIYCEWETDDAEWNYFRSHFLKPQNPK
jgi:hypothetical protein